MEENCEENEQRDCTKEFMKPSFLKKFIEAYRSFPCLWKINSKEYSNQVTKGNAYDKLLELCKEVNANANIDWVKMRIKNLRTVFRKEMKKMKTSQKSGAGTDDIYKPKLWYFELMMFTADQEMPRQSLSSIQKDGTSDLRSTISEENKDMETERATETTQVRIMIHIYCI